MSRMAGDAISAVAVRWPALSVTAARRTGRAGEGERDAGDAAGGDARQTELNRRARPRDAHPCRRTAAAGPQRIPHVVHNQRAVRDAHFLRQSDRDRDVQRIGPTVVANLGYELDASAVRYDAQFGFEELGLEHETARDLERARTAFAPRDLAIVGAHLAHGMHDARDHRCRERFAGLESRSGHPDDVVTTGGDATGRSSHGEQRVARRTVAVVEGARSDPDGVGVDAFDDRPRSVTVEPRRRTHADGASVSDADRIPGLESPLDAQLAAIVEPRGDADAQRRLGFGARRGGGKRNLDRSLRLEPGRHHKAQPGRRRRPAPVIALPKRDLHDIARTRALRLDTQRVEARFVLLRHGWYGAQCRSDDAPGCRRAPRRSFTKDAR